MQKRRCAHWFLKTSKVATCYKTRISCSRALESYARFSPIFWECGQRTLVLECLVGRNPTYPVALALLKVRQSDKITLEGKACFQQWSGSLGGVLSVCYTFHTMLFVWLVYCSCLSTYDLESLTQISAKSGRKGRQQCVLQALTHACCVVVHLDSYISRM